MKKMIFVVLLVMLMILPGCDKGSSIDDDYANLNGETGKEVTNTNVQPVPTTLDYTVTSKSGNGAMDIKADVIKDGYDSPVVFDIDKVKVDENYLKDMAAKIFDGGAYTVEKPYFICSESELNTLQDDFLATMQETTVENYPEAVGDVAALLENHDSSAEREFKEGQVIAHIEDAGTYTWGKEEKTFEIDTAMLNGTINGKKYQLYYVEYAQGITLKLRTMEPVTMANALCAMDSDVFESMSGENTCDIEESRKQAREILDNAGYNDFMECSCAKRKCYDRTNNSFLDGYNIYYTRSINGIPNLITDNTKIVTQDSMEKGEESSYGVEYVCVRVDHTGIIGVDFYNPYQVTGDIKAATEVLSFDQVDEIAQETMKDLMEKVEYEDANFFKYFSRNNLAVGDVNRVQFTYIPVNYEGKYTYVPAWLYVCDYSNSSDVLYFTNYIGLMAVNAIDGSVTYFYYSNPLTLTNYYYYY